MKVIATNTYRIYLYPCVVNSDLVTRTRPSANRNEKGATEMYLRCALKVSRNRMIVHGLGHSCHCGGNAQSNPLTTSAGDRFAATRLAVTAPLRGYIFRINR